jgi:hypothetical protein
VDWDDVVQWCAFQLRGDSLETRLCKLSLGAVIYHIWMTRNHLIHGSTPSTEESLISKIRCEVRSRIMAKGGYTSPAENLKLLKIWNLQNIV